MEDKKIDFYTPPYDRIGFVDPFDDSFKRIKKKRFRKMNKQLSVITGLLIAILVLLVLFLIRSLNGAL